MFHHQMLSSVSSLMSRMKRAMSSVSSGIHFQRRGLIQQREPWVPWKGPSQFDPFLHTEGKHANGFFTEGLYFEKLDDLLDSIPVQHFLLQAFSPIREPDRIPIEGIAAFLHELSMTVMFLNNSILLKRTATPGVRCGEVSGRSSLSRSGGCFRRRACRQPLTRFRNRRLFRPIGPIKPNS